MLDSKSICSIVPAFCYDACCLINASVLSCISRLSTCSRNSDGFGFQRRCCIFIIITQVYIYVVGIFVNKCRTIKLVLDIKAFTIVVFQIEFCTSVTIAYLAVVISYPCILIICYIAVCILGIGIKFIKFCLFCGDTAPA